MKKYLFIISLITISLYSCSKEEGEGGRSSISGIVHMTDITGGVQGEYNVPDYDVYIIYGDDDDVYDDDMKTNYDGSFTFNNLREGSYKVYAYTQDLTKASGVSAVFASETIGKDEQANVGTIEVKK